MSDPFIIPKEFEELVQGAFENIGPRLAKIMKGVMKENEQTDMGRTENSVTWATYNAVDRALAKGPGVLDTDIIGKSDNRLGLNIGTAVPYAEYIEHGSTHHQSGSPAESKRFVSNMLAWAQRHGFRKKDGSMGTLNEDDIYPLLKKIRDYGTDANPFLEESKRRIAVAVKDDFNQALTALMRQTFGNKVKRSTVDVRVYL
jgi:hypothetical protein